MGFKDYIKQQEFVDFLVENFDNEPELARPHQFSTIDNKPWSATKDQILQMWRSLRTDVPINITPIDVDTPGVDDSSYGEDGIRITGTWNFIATVLGRLKDLMLYENPHTRLRLVFRGIDSTRDARPDRQTYVFYINLERRSHGKPGRPKKGNLRVKKGFE